MNEKEIINCMVLARLNYYSLGAIKRLYLEAGSATTVVENHKNIRDIIPDATPKLIEILRDCEVMRPRVEEEMEFVIFVVIIYGSIVRWPFDSSLVK